MTPNEPNSAAPGAPKKDAVLLVDDEKPLLEVYAAALSPDGIRIERQVSTSAASEHEHGAETVAQSTTSKDPTPEEMDAMHEAGVKSFPAPTKGKGGQPLATVLAEGTDVSEVERACAERLGTLESMLYDLPKEKGAHQ